jgi:hypothetical protein
MLSVHSFEATSFRKINSFNFQQYMCLCYVHICMYVCTYVCTLTSNSNLRLGLGLTFSAFTLTEFQTGKGKRCSVDTKMVLIVTSHPRNTLEC